MHVEPITCLRPTPEHVAEFCALPYDVYTSEQARAYVECHPRTFLAIDRPETSFEPGHDPHAPEVYAQAAKLLRERQLDRTLIIDEKPCFYLYEQSRGGHTQMGLMGAVAADDYLDGTICRHELTLHDKEADRVRHIEGLRAQTGPVFITYRDSMAVDVILDAARSGEPLYDFVSEDGVRQRVWRIARPVAIDALSVTFSTIPHGYIADGHHRAAAAVSICQKRREEGRVDDPSDHFLAVLFPASQLKILPYDRIIADTAGLTEDELVRAITGAGLTCSEPIEDPVDPADKGTFGMYAFGHWRTLRAEGASNELDVSVLQDKVLGPILNIEDPRRDSRIEFAGGVSASQIEQVTPAGGVSFTLFPTSMDELMAISDAGGLMPPKSTWFEPKLLSGIALRRIW